MSDTKTEPGINAEQIKNKNDQNTGFYNDLELFIRNDEFGLFKTREIRRIEKDRQKSQKEIESLLALKVKATKVCSQLLAQRKDLTQKTLALKTTLIKELKLQ